MRKVYRQQTPLDYWNTRWQRAGVDQARFTNLDIYPIKYVLPYLKRGMRILEAGCGAGRLLSHLHHEGYTVIGFDYAWQGVSAFAKQYPNIPVQAADITHMPYKDNTFDMITAFGVFHSIESLEIIHQGLCEIKRCLKQVGRAIISVRAQTLENALIDWITTRRQGRGNCFHKWCFKKHEFASLLLSAGLKIENVCLASNVSFLYKYHFLRRYNEESKNRAEGFPLNIFGKGIYRLLDILMPGQFGTTYVYIVH